VGGDGAATYTFVPADQGRIVLGLSSATRESLFVGVTDGTIGGWSTENPALSFGPAAIDRFSSLSYAGSDGTAP
jgi:hypothetical protein